MAASAVAGLVVEGWVSPLKIASVAALFALAGMLAFAPAVLAARMLSAGRAREFRLALNLLSLAVATTGTTAVLYALQYRFYYDEWHAPAFSTVWFYELAFTGLAAIYQFAVLGARLFFPVGFAALLVAAFWLTRRER